jgi:hypothetical protein
LTAFSKNLARDLPALFAFLEARSAVPFDWTGDNDCWAFAALAVKAQTGVDPRGRLRWKTRVGALRLLKKEGGLVAAWDARLSQVPVALAARGDVAAVPDELLGFRALIVEGATLVGPGERGLVRLPRNSAVFAWDALSVHRVSDTGVTEGLPSV